MDQKRVAEMKSFFVFGGFSVVLAVCWLALMPVLVCAQESGQDKPASPLENLPTLGSKLTDSQVVMFADLALKNIHTCLLYTSPSPRDGLLSRMPSSA